MPSAFDLASAVQPLAASSNGQVAFTAQVPTGWDQGRGAFGGLVLGLLARAAIAAEIDKSRSLRTLLGDIAGPVQPGEVQLTARTLRRGNNQSNVAIELSQNGEVLSLGSAVLASARKPSMPEFALDVPSPAPDWRTIEIARVRPPQGPAFGQHIEFRPVLGLPFSGAPAPDVRGFVRLVGQEGPLDAPALIALLDAHWPGVLSRATGPRVASTVSFAGEIFCDPASLDWQVPLDYRARIVAQHGGYFLELRELWQRGAPVAMNQQTLALIR